MVNQNLICQVKINKNISFYLFKLLKKIGLDGERIILECGVSTFCFTFKQKKENDIINLKKNSDVSARIASKTYQLPIKKQINDNGKTTKNKEEYESKKSFFNFCSCN